MHSRARLAVGALALLSGLLAAPAPASAAGCYCGDGLTPILGCCGGDGERACIVESVFSDCERACKPGNEQLVLALGASCYRPRNVGESCGPGAPCAENATCIPVTQQCFPSDSVGADVLVAPICDAFYNEPVSDAVQWQAAWDLSRGYHTFGLDLSFLGPLGSIQQSMFDGLVTGSRQFGLGAATGAGVGASTEFGVAYGKDGEFGCYVTDCVIAGGVLSAGFNACMSVNVVEADADPGAGFASIEGQSWNAFADAGEAVTVGGSFGFNSLENVQAAVDALISTAQHPLDLQALSNAAPDAYSQCIGVGVGSPVNAGYSACLTAVVRTRSPGLPPTVYAGGSGYGDVVLRGAEITLGTHNVDATWSADATEFRWDIGNDWVYDTTKPAETWTNSPFTTWTFDGPEFDQPRDVTAKLYARNAAGQQSSSPRSYFVVPCTGPPDEDGDGLGDACDGCDSVDSTAQFQDPDHDGVWDACDRCPYDPANDSDGDGVCGGAKIGSCRTKTAEEIFTGVDCRIDGDCTAIDPDTFCYGVPYQPPGLCSNQTPASQTFQVLSGSNCSNSSDCHWYANFPKCTVEIDNCDTPNAPAASGLQADADHDSWGDACDNCPTKYNPDQDPTDSDGDGTPDACDTCQGPGDNTDFDGDLICDRDDNCPLVENGNQSDLNGDGIGDRCEQIATQKIGNAEGGFGGALVFREEFGRALARLGDLDGNGVTDLAVGMPFCDDGVSDGGCVWILFLNAQGSVVDEQKISATAGGLGAGIDATDWFGNAVAGLGDLDGDGVPDLAVGAPFDDDGGENAGAVSILFLRRDGTVKAKRKITPSVSGAGFGRSVAAVGDTDGDGVVDLAVGAFGGGGDPGRVWIVSLRTDGSVAASRELTGIDLASDGIGGLGDLFGSSVAPLGDLDGDGVSELAVGAIGSDSPFDTDAGAVYLLSFEPDGSVDRFTKLQANSVNGGPTLPGGRSGGYFGRSVQSLGDLDGDGFVELAVGAPADGPLEREGQVQVLFLEPAGWTFRRLEVLGRSSNPGGPFRQLLATLEQGDYFGVSLAALGDLDGDGGLELAVGASRDDSIYTDLGSDLGAVWIVHYPGAPSACGNRVLDPAEECDDGATLGGDGCSTACKIERFVEVFGTAAGGRIFVTLDGVRVYVDTQLGDDAGRVALDIQEALVAVGLGDRVSIRFGSQLWFTGGADVATYDPGLFLSTSPAVDPVNLALASRGGVATQSSTDAGGTASRANDGNRDGNFFDGSVTHTSLEASPYWQVGLAGGPQAVGRVVVYNRTDGEPLVADRINPFTVELRKAGVRVAGFDGQTFLTDVEQPNVAGMMFDFGGRVGDTVRVSLPGRTQYLQLAEVEVYGVPEIEPGGVCDAGPSAARLCYDDVDCAPSCTNGGAACRDDADCRFGSCFTGGGACREDADCSSLKMCNNSPGSICQSDADCPGTCTVHGFGGCQRDSHCQEQVYGSCNPATGLCEGPGNATGSGCVDSSECLGTVTGVCRKPPGVCRSGLDFCSLTDQGSCSRSAQCIPEPGGALLAAAALGALSALARSRRGTGRRSAVRAHRRS